MVKTIDEHILVIDEFICGQIDMLAEPALDSASQAIDESALGATSQAILARFRTLTEHIMLKFYAKKNGVKDIENTYPNITAAIRYVRGEGRLKLLRRFHDSLQRVQSHYMQNKDGSRRLMLEYIDYLYKIRTLVHNELGLDILGNLEKFPIDTRPVVQEYYEKISERIQRCSSYGKTRRGRYYIQKIKPFPVASQLYYEVTFSQVSDRVDKFDRLIAFTNLEIKENYAVCLSLHADQINMLGKTMPIQIITDWAVSIRACEYRNFAALIQADPKEIPYKEKSAIDSFLTKTSFNLSELLELPNGDYQGIKAQISQDIGGSDPVFFSLLNLCREIVEKEKPGANLLRYLLYRMNNRTLKSQYQSEANPKMSGLYIKFGSLPFDTMPFFYFPVGHTPLLQDLYACISTEGRQPELLARWVMNNTEQREELFTPLEDLNEFDDIPALVEAFNSADHWFEHKRQNMLVIEHRNIFINHYKDDFLYIIKRLQSLASSGIPDYITLAQDWITKEWDSIVHEKGSDDKGYAEKKRVLESLFADSRVALVTGDAGTGKTTLVDFVTRLFGGSSILILSQTHASLNNLRQRVTTSHCKFSTVAKYLRKHSSGEDDENFDLVILDECSTVGNQDMRDLLKKAETSAFLLVGDSYQLPSIRFGNWFRVIEWEADSKNPVFLPSYAKFTLKEVCRSEHEALKGLWKRVRNMDDHIPEAIIGQDYFSSLDESIFAPAGEDEIILCPRYDGFYGINNINCILQQSNPNSGVTWGDHTYKVNDPILFNDSKRFGKVLYNNLRGRIRGVRILDAGKPLERILFDVEVDTVIESDRGVDFQLRSSPGADKSLLRFHVTKTKSTDEDSGSDMDIVPFRISYAISIHKAQSLEFHSVKLVIPDEVDDIVNHGVFYTAITRTKKDLKIYCTPEVGHKVLGTMHLKNIRKEANLLKNYL